MTFDGIDGEFSIAGTSPNLRVTSWELAAAEPSQPQVDRVASLPQGQWHTDGSAEFNRHQRIVVVNESYSPDWNANRGVAAHVASLFGTNVYVTDDAPLLIRNVHATEQRLCYLAGSLLILLAIASLTVVSTMREDLEA
jgi:hypothetical protein